ncbi:MAG: cation:proton antiporter [Gammaproteobacteria bacterium]
MHDLTLITMLATALAAALALGWFTQRLGLSPIVGYLVAGIVVGPHTPGFVADTRLASQLSEIGVILLMFGVGLHFHPQDLLRVWRIALPGAIAQSAIATLLGVGIAVFFGWSPTSGLILGMGLAVASTVVLMRMLGEQGRLASNEGHLAVGWLIVEDIFTVLALVILPAIAVSTTPLNLCWSILFAIVKVMAFSLIIWFLGPRIISPILERMAKIRSAELFTLSVFVIAISVAAIAAEVFHVSVALGAFVGGLVVAQSRVGHQASTDMLPFKNVFSALFFVSVGMLFDPDFAFYNPGILILALLVIMVAKPLVAVAIVLLLKGNATTALTVAIGLAQIGEFSFILAALSYSLGLLPTQGYDLLIAAALISISLNPILFRLIPIFESWLASSKQNGINVNLKNQVLENPPTVILVGYGKTGKSVAETLIDDIDNLVIIDKDFNAVEEALQHGLRAHYGNGRSEAVLIAAGITSAKYIMIMFSSITDAMDICQSARRLNPTMQIISLANTESEKKWLEEFGSQYTINPHEEVKKAIELKLQRGKYTT